MATKTYYPLTHADGTVGTYTFRELQELGTPEAKIKIERILSNINTRRRVKDGFEPGIQPSINEYCGGPQEYAQKLKERGLVEAGRGFVPKDSASNEHPCANPSFAKKIVEQFGPTAGNLAESVESGEYFKRDTYVSKLKDSV